jgi:hypothetical protein
MQPLHVCTLEGVRNDGIQIDAFISLERRLREIGPMRPNITTAGRVRSRRRTDVDDVLRAAEGSRGTST